MVSHGCWTGGWPQGEDPLTHPPAQHHYAPAFVTGEEVYQQKCLAMEVGKGSKNFN